MMRSAPFLHCLHDQDNFTVTRYRLDRASHQLRSIQNQNISLIHPVLLCGGSGTRLWPSSRQSFPKQFARLMGEESLFQASARRLSGEGFAAPVVVTGDPFRFLVTEQLAQVALAAAATLIEPEARNTAPAVLAAALWLAMRDPDALMIVSPSDHVIPDSAAFRAAVRAARAEAEVGGIVTFGIRPDQPETGYGYLELAEDSVAQASGIRRLRRFVEKPEAARAAAMLDSGLFLWNAGIFLFKAKTIIAAFGRHVPQMLSGVTEAVQNARTDLGYTRLAPRPCRQSMPSHSMDSCAGVRLTAPADACGHGK
jgi:mannose-1-phosphate guanylyltransferase / mannose-6-phosphate isomerase